jgi:hypothetical protein
VVDEQGKAIARAQVRGFSFPFGNAGPFRPDASTSTTTDGEGRFALEKLLPPGRT